MVDQVVKLRIDKKADALYLRLDDSRIVGSEEVSPGVILDFNESSEVIAIEMLNLSRRGMNTSVLEFQYYNG